ncbi:MAG: polyphosphate polymerase domain-containing protein [Planctomycetota bacterium]
MNQRTAAADGLHSNDGIYELKFVVPDDLAERVLAWARSHLAADPHAEAALGDGYRVHSVYLDTIDFDTYHGRGPHGRIKYRLRRYGAETGVFLERKSKARGLVRKRRTLVPETDLSYITGGITDRNWSGHWYQRRLHERRLAPTSQVMYERIARVGETPEGPIRLTVDRQLRCCPADEFNVRPFTGGVEFLIGQAIVEMKFHAAVPALFKRLIQELTLAPEGVSKYRASIEACGLATSVDHELRGARRGCSESGGRNA